MITTNPFDFCVKFEVPPDYTPPQAFEDQANCAEYPNINTSQYRQKPADHQLKLLPFYQCMSRNSEGTVILGTNCYQSRSWHGSIYAYENVDEDIPELETKEAIYKSFTESSVADIQFIDDTLFVMGESNGQMTLYSTRSVMRETEDNKYCFFSIGQKKQHKSYVNCMDIYKTNPQKMISGDASGWLITWDLGNADLTSLETMRFAHTDAINSVSTSLDNDNCFVTASDDKNLYHFDMRDPRPCTALMENHDFQLKAVEFLNDHQLLVGDRKGIAYVIDTKMPKEVLLQKELFDRSVHRFVVKGNNVIALGNSNRLQVQQFNGKELLSVFDTTDAPDFLRAAAWINETEFYVAGWSSFMKKYKI